LFKIYVLYRFKKYINFVRMNAHDINELIKEKSERKNRRSVIIYLIRHGESIMNVNGHLISGRSSSSPLSENGICQAHLLGERLRNDDVKFESVYASTTLRAFDTAKIATKQTHRSQ